MWVLADVVGLFSIKVGSFSRNVGRSGPIFLANLVSKPWMLSDRVVYVLRPLQLRVPRSIALMTLVSGCLAFASAFAQRFDCKNASTTVERAICGDKGLADLDDQLANDVRKLVAAQPAMRATYLEDELEWISERDHHCTAPNAEQSLNDCLVAYDLARFADIRGRSTTSG